MLPFITVVPIAKGEKANIHKFIRIQQRENKSKSTVRNINKQYLNTSAEKTVKWLIGVKQDRVHLERFMEIKTNRILRVEEMDLASKAWEENYKGGLERKDLMMPTYLSPLSVSDHVTDVIKRHSKQWEGIYGPSREKHKEGTEIWMHF